jgi:hypothetical protein
MMFLCQKATVRKLVLVALFLIRQQLSNKIFELFGKREMNQNF